MTNKRNLEDSLNEKIYIKTSGGNGIYNAYDEITVQVSPQVYLRKKVSDLNSGEQVLFYRQETQTTLEDVEPFLENNPVYDRATNFVYQFDKSTGKKSPIFKKTLWQSLFSAGANPKCEKNAALILEDLLQNEIKDFEEIYIPGSAAIELWFSGETLAPRDQNIFYLLNRIFPEKFNYFLSDQDDINGFYKNYRIHVVLRQSIMRKLNSWKGTSESHEDSGDGKSKIEIRKIIEQIERQFLGDLTPELKTVRVLDIQKIKGAKEKYLRKFDGLLGDGLITDEVDEVSKYIKETQELLEHERIVYEYVLSTVKLIPLSNEPSFIGKENILLGVIPELLSRFKEPLNDYMKFQLENRNKYLFHYDRSNHIIIESKPNQKELSDIKKFENEAVEKILNGEVDKDLNLNFGTTMRLFETFFRLNKALPNQIHQIRLIREKLEAPIFFNTLKRKDKKNLRSDYKSLGVELNRYYGFKSPDPDHMEISATFLSYALESAIQMVSNQNKSIPTKEFMGNQFYSYFNDKSFMLRLLKILKEQDVILRTRYYTQDILSKYGLEEIVNLKREEFKFDKEWDQLKTI